MKKVLILYSGGADSVCMLSLALKLGHLPTLLLIRYGQKHLEEIATACARLPDHLVRLAGALELPGLPMIKYHTLDLTSSFADINSNLLQESQGASYPGVHDMHVPGRNTIMAAVAIGLAESNGHDEVWIGADFSDRLNSFPDCFQEWVVAMDTVASLQGHREIRLRAPLLGLEKDDVITLLKRDGIDMDGVFTGYTAPEKRN